MPTKSMAVEHTPGPWQCLDGEGGRAYIAREGTNGGRRTPVAVAGGMGNGRLIAAAPELLASLEWIVRWTAARLASGSLSDVSPDWLAWYERACETIAKARGQ